MKSAMVGASPIDGSSSISSFGEEARPRPIATICCSPPDSVPASWSRRSASTGSQVRMRSRLSFQLRRPASVKAPISRFSITVSDGNTWRPFRHMGDAEMRPARGRHGGEVDALEADARRPSA